MLNKREIGYRKQAERLLAYLHLQASKASGVVVLAVLVGTGAGYGAVLFRFLIARAHVMFFDWGGVLLRGMGHYFVIVVPAGGGLLVGLMVHFLAREVRGHGVPEVMLAVSRFGGKIRPRVAAVKALASSICIGSGGSAGREGPIVQIGSALGSTLGQVFRLPEERTKMLVACGGAGGISATFNAPIAGVMFALEVLLREFTARSFGIVVLASVSASVVSRAYLGDYPAFRVPPYALVSGWELPLYALLGVLSGLGGLLFTRVLYRTEDLFDALPMPEFLKPVLGGLLIGSIGVWLPQVFGVGYDTIEIALNGHLAVGILLALWVAKLAATSLTLGSGGSGGVFAPSLFMGSMLGGAFGMGIHALWPHSTGQPGAYAIVGMGAVFAGAAHAPVTAILILFEMTGDYRIILPLMVAAVISALLAGRLSADSIYTLKLRRRGVKISSGREINPMDTVLVSAAMTADAETVPEDLTVPGLMSRFSKSGRHGFPVVGSHGRLTGVVTLFDVQAAAADQEADITVGDICTRKVITCLPDQTLNQALAQAGARDVGRLIVVDCQDPTRIVGYLSRRDIIAAYARALTDRAELHRQVGDLELGVAGLVHVRTKVGKGSSADGTPLRELPIPNDALLVSLARGSLVVIPKGGTVLEEGDVVSAVAAPEVEQEVRALFEARPRGATDEPIPPRRDRSH